LRSTWQSHPGGRKRDRERESSRERERERERGDSGFVSQGKAEMQRCRKAEMQRGREWKQRQCRCTYLAKEITTAILFDMRIVNSEK
jgi:hypothetical protein